MTADDDGDSGGAEDRIRDYKLLLSRVLEQRPSGTRQRLADALGKHRSFVTQITSATYSTPIPQKHLATILSVCHFSAAEHESFMTAYRLAHPRRHSIGDPERKTRHLTLLVPDLGADNAAFDKAVAEFVQRMTSLIRRPNE